MTADPSPPFAPTLPADAVAANLEPSWESKLEYLRGLVAVLQEHELSELEVESDGLRYRLCAASPVPPAGVPLALHGMPLAAAAAPPSAKPAAPSGPAAEALVAIVSPMVGVWYRSPSPQDQNFVEVGDRVEVGQTVGLVEAMKVFNEISAEFEGIVAEIAAQTGSLVETGIPLIRLRRG